MRHWLAHSRGRSSNAQHKEKSLGRCSLLSRSAAEYWPEVISRLTRTLLQGIKHYVVGALPVPQISQRRLSARVSAWQPDTPQTRQALLKSSRKLGRTLYCGTGACSTHRKRLPRADGKAAE